MNWRNIIKRFNSYLLLEWVWLRDGLTSDLEYESMEETPSKPPGSTPPGSDFETLPAQEAPSTSPDSTPPGYDFETLPAFENNAVVPNQAPNLEEIQAPNLGEPNLGLISEQTTGEIAMEQTSIPDAEENIPYAGSLQETNELAEVPTSSEGDATSEPADDLMSIFSETLEENDDLRNLVRDLKDVEINDLSSQCKDMAAKLKLYRRR